MSAHPLLGQEEASHSVAPAALQDSARRRSQRPPTRPSERAGARTGFGDPDFLELCDLVQQVLRPQAAPAQRLRDTLRAMPRAVRLIGAVRRLPSRRIQVTDSPAGAAIRGFFGRRPLEGRHVMAISTLDLPTDPAEYARGRSRQALRTNCTRARRMGVRVGRVDDPAQVRERMTDLFTRRQDADAGAWYFNRAAQGEGEFWFATHPDGHVIAVTEIIADREAALLRSMISAPGPGRSEARYLLMSEVMASLAGRGVRHVLVGRALRVPRGLIYFQRLLGFTPMNLTLVEGPRMTGRTGPAGAPTRGGGRPVDPDAIEQAVTEYAALRREALRQEDADPGLEAVLAAVFLEDVLGLRVTDEDIAGDLFEDPPALRRVIDRSLDRKGAVG